MFDDIERNLTPGKAPQLSVTEFLELCNQTLDYAYSGVIIEGEVASYKVSQGKWVFFDLKDEESSVGCFLPLFQQRMPLADGMKIRVQGVPKVTKWGKFSVTVRQMMPVGEGNIKKSFELLKAKLAAEGLFSSEHKRPVPEDLARIGVISSTQAAGYADFCKIINARWGGLAIQVAHTAVQGMGAADQIIRALKYFNERSEVQIIAILRGGGSADDLAVFNDEALARAIAASKIPVITGIGHEVDESLADLVADVRASTPSNAAEMLSPDRAAERRRITELISGVGAHILRQIDAVQQQTAENVGRAFKLRVSAAISEVESKLAMLKTLDPDLILQRGYAIITGQLSPGNVVKITTFSQEIQAEVKQVKERSKNAS